MSAPNPRALVDPELLPLLDAWPQMRLSAETLPLLRDPAWLPIPPITHPERVAKTTATAPGRDGAPDVALTLYRPACAAGALPCIYHIHGGGYVAGSVVAMEPVHRGLAHDLGCAVVAVEYRLAPETAFPGPLEDCYAGLDWTFRHAGANGIDPARIGVMGESAGGGLAAGLALLARDRGEHALAFQHLIYPMLDDRTCAAPDAHPHAGAFVWTAESNRFGWASYLGAVPGGGDIPAHAAPARATDLAGLPPAYISTGALDLFLEEDLDYARRLSRAGVPIELHVYPGSFHGFDFAPEAAVSIQARRDSVDALRRATYKTA